jgi:hypothetical protein
MREEGSTESFSSLPTYDDSHPPDNLELVNSATKKRCSKQRSTENPRREVLCTRRRRGNNL